MTWLPQTTQPACVSHSLFIELMNSFLEPLPTRGWLQKVVNLLKQYLLVKHVTIHAYADNLIVYASDDLSRNARVFCGVGHVSSKPYWFGTVYVVPLSVEGILEIVWDKIPDTVELANYNHIFQLLNSSLRNRSSLINQSQQVLYQESLSRTQTILSDESTIKCQLNLVAKEIASVLCVSRCQIKFFSFSTNSFFDNELIFEFASGDFLTALSVIPEVERVWLEKVQKHENVILDQPKCYVASKISEDLESLISIQSILGCPILYKGKAIGVMVLHQCDYERIWKKEEISFLKEVLLLLGVIVGREFALEERYAGGISTLGSSIINADDFLREVSHLQIEAQVSNSCFSLVMVDIERLKDINLKAGFVAGNLVLSQTARYIRRLYGDTYRIARYSNDEFVVIMKNIDEDKARSEAERLKEYLNNVSVLGVGPVDYNFSFVTFPRHADSIAKLLTLLEQAMILSKSRGKSQVSTFDAVQEGSPDKRHKLVSDVIPEIILRKSNLKTGPKVVKTINEYLSQQKNRYSADILDAVQSLAIALDAKDSYTEGHSKRVSEFACILARSLGLDLQEIEWIRLAASMHDIGKIGIPERILCKPAKLTADEYEVMKKHPVIGARILKPIKPLEKVANLVLCHHEYWDGSGYPNGLSKDEIPIGARIVSIADAYQAMTSNRPYRSALPSEQAIEILKNGKEKQWDPELVELFIEVVLS